MVSALAFIERRAQSDDVLYVSCGAQYTLAYYARCDCRDLGFERIWPIRPGKGGTDQWSPATSNAPPSALVEPHAPTDPGSPIDRVDRGTVWIVLGDVPIAERARPRKGHCTRTYRRIVRRGGNGW